MPRSRCDAETVSLPRDGIKKSSATFGFRGCRVVAFCLTSWEEEEVRGGEGLKCLRVMARGFVAWSDRRAVQLERVLWPKMALVAIVGLPKSRVMQRR
jgi:hypothetical protein